MTTIKPNEEQRAEPLNTESVPRGISGLSRTVPVEISSNKGEPQVREPARECPYCCGWQDGARNRWREHEHKK